MAPWGGLRWPPLGALLTTGLLSVGPVSILAQTSTVVCGSSSSWMDNSLNQDPCVVAAYLQSVCTNGQYTVNPLPPNIYYTGPNVGQENNCVCSTVTYCTMSACGACQNTGFVGWDAWSYNCTALSVGFFQPGIPDGTAVPAWAYQNMAQTGYIFNVTLAQSVGDNPESTATHAQSTGSPGATSTVASASPTNSASASTSSSSNPNTAAIAGAVGGAVGAALIAAIIIFLKRRRVSKSPPSASADPPPDYSDPVNPLFRETALPRLYDPSDPSTFPPSVSPISFMAESSSNVNNHSSPSVHPGRYYTGRPEI